MTDHNDARVKAVEAAASALRDNALAELGKAPIGPFSASAEDVREYWLNRARISIDTFERTMAEAGWVRVRDCGDMAYAAPVPVGTSPLAEHDRHLHDMLVPGWNACRAAMLAGRSGEDG